MTPATWSAPANNDATTEPPVNPSSAAATAELMPGTSSTSQTSPRRTRTPRDAYQRRRETAAAALLIAGGSLIWSHIHESVTALLGRSTTGEPGKNEKRSPMGCASLRSGYCLVTLAGDVMEQLGKDERTYQRRSAANVATWDRSPLVKVR